MQILLNYNLQKANNNSYSINKIYKNKVAPNKISTQNNEILFKGLDLFGEINKDKIISAQGVTDEDKKHFIEELAKLTYTDGNGKVVRVFDDSCIYYIKNLLPSIKTKQSLEFIKELASATYTDENEKVVRVFDDSCIYYIKNLLPNVKTSQQLEFIKELTKLTYTDERNKKIRALTKYDIEEIFPHIKSKEQLKITRILASATYTNERNKKVRALNGCEIRSLLQYIKTEERAELAKELAQITYANEKNKKVKALDIWDIKKLLSHIKSKEQLELAKQLARKTKLDESGKRILEFNSDNIRQLVKIYTQENIENVDKLLAYTYIDKNGDTLSMFNSEEVYYLITSYDSKNLAKFIKYINTVDFEQLKRIVPEIKDFTPRQYLSFLKYNYQNETTDFTREDLTLDKDFTNYLMQNYLNADGLTDLLSIYPATDRKVGSIPNDWIKDFSPKDQKRVKDEVYSEIENFRKTNDIDEFASKMSKIFGKKVKITKLGSGGYGTGYKISMDGRLDLCLKIFHNREIDVFTTNYHGPYIEPQTGLFANKHSNNFVKMYFGKVAPVGYKDGFLVTQFLSNETIPEENTDIQEGYTVISEDTSGGRNDIHNKIIDFGDVKIVKK